MIIYSTILDKTMSGSAFPYCYEQYCEGDCLKKTKNNLLEYMGFYVTAYPTCNAFAVGSNALNGRPYCYNCFYTTLCLPVKLPMLLPCCPFTIFCPHICKGDICCSKTKGKNKI